MLASLHWTQILLLTFSSAMRMCTCACVCMKEWEAVIKGVDVGLENADLCMCMHKGMGST